jgi:hypothetical protein
MHSSFRQGTLGMAADMSPADSAPITLRALKLRPGMFLQARPRSGGEPIEAKFCAAIEGKGLMVVPLNGGRDALRDGTPLNVGGFTGLYDFSFESQVLQSFTHPFAYTLLAWPAAVSARRVRNALRIPTALPAEVDAGSGLQVATIIDLSVAGAMLRSPEPLGAVGASARIGFRINIDDRPTLITLEGVVCHGARCESGNGYRTGYAFSALGRNERIALQCFTLMAGEPSAVV